LPFPKLHFKKIGNLGKCQLSFDEKIKISSVTSNFNNISKKDGIIYKIIFQATFR
jgi:hypothetical protein